MKDTDRQELVRINDELRETLLAARHFIKYAARYTDPKDMIAQIDAAVR